MGLVVETAASSREALKLLAKSHPFDAAILDLQLPDMDGLTLADEIRKQPGGRHLPLLLLSSVRLRGDDTRPLHASIAVVVYKPIRPAQLLDALCRGLSIQLQREKPPFAPSLDANMARRLPLRLLLPMTIPSTRKWASASCKLGYRSDMPTMAAVLTALEQNLTTSFFLDVQMPKVDGLGGPAVWRWPAEKRPRIVAMTGNALTGIAKSAFRPAWTIIFLTRPHRRARPPSNAGVRHAPEKRTPRFSPG
jgi:CheY-like chemotaxis protein